jgi:hypothetical protein
VGRVKRLKEPNGTVMRSHGVLLTVVPPATELARTAKERGQNMEQYIEQYQARDGGVTLHTWTEVQGSKTENFYITGAPGAAIPMGFRNVLRQKNLLARIIHQPEKWVRNDVSALSSKL